MGKRTKRTSSDSFESEVQRQFGRLATRIGLDGPVEGGVVLPTVAYRGDQLTYTWMLDDLEHYLSVYAAVVVAGGTLSISIEEFVPGAGLGARQHVRTGAQTWHSLQLSIASHVRWLKTLHPLLTGPEAERLLNRAGARRFTSDLD